MLMLIFFGLFFEFIIKVRVLNDEYRLLSKKIRAILFLNLYFCFLLYVYVDYISVVFEYEGFSSDFDIIRFFEAFFLVNIISPFIVTDRKSTSTFFSTLLFLIVFIPIAALYVGSSEDRFAFYIAFFAVLYVCFIVYIFSKSNIFIKIPHVRAGTKIAIYVMVFFVLLFLIKMLLNGALFNINFDLTKVYELRDAQQALIYDGVWGYLTNWTVKVFSIALVIYSLYSRHYLVFLSLVLLQFVFFGVTTHKSTFFYVVVSVVIYYFLKRDDANYSFIKIFVISIISSFLIANLLSNIYVGSFLLRRALFVPANLHFVYVDFFSQNNFVFWSNSILKSFVDYPYTTSTANVIGLYLGKPGLAANNGFIASGYMQAGVVGVAIYSIVLTKVFILFDMLRKSLPSNVIAAISIGPILSVLTSADLLTSLLTHGLLIVIIVSYFLNSKISKKGK